METLSHSSDGRVILTGTPKDVENHIEDFFARSTGCRWTTTCAACKTDVVPDERCLGSDGPICPSCGAPIDFREGRWVAANPDAKSHKGFWINHLMTPWLSYDQVLDRQRTYDIVKFKNEALGLPTTAGELVVTRAGLENCCDSRPMARAGGEIQLGKRAPLIAGIDWGGGGVSRTVIVIGTFTDNYVFRIWFMRHLPRTEDPGALIDELAAMCRHFGVRCIATDGAGNGLVFNRLLIDRLGAPMLPFYAITYANADQEPRQEGALFKWTVGRTPSIGTVMARIKKGTLRFPALGESGPFLDEFACVTAEYNPDTRAVKYSHPETRPDDTLHATNCAMIAAMRAFHGPDH